MQAILVILFLLVGLIVAFRSRTASRIGVSDAQMASGGCGCLSLIAIIVLGVLFRYTSIPQFPFGATLLLIIAAIGIIIGGFAGVTTDQQSGKGTYDFGVSLIVVSFFWILTAYLYFAIFHLSFQVSLSSILILAAFIVGESIAVYWTTSLLKRF